MSGKNNNKISLRRLLLPILAVFSVAYLVNRAFGIKGTIVFIGTLLVVRLVDIFRKRDNVARKLFGLLLSIIYVAAIILTKIKEDWFGFWGLIAIFIGMLGYRLFFLFKGWGYLKNMMVDFWKIIEKQQLGRDLDDPYWDTHKKPNIIQLLRGTYVPRDKNGVIIEDELKTSNNNKGKV